jgi:threonyl-tRNA synthetase
MGKIRLMDGKELTFSHPISIEALAKEIGEHQAIAAKVNGKIVDLSTSIAGDAEVVFVYPQDPEGLEIIRHSTAHLLAHAVKSLYPDTQVTIGPVVEDGFYYDFSRPGGFTADDLENIEAKMKELAKANFPIERLEISRHEAIELFASMGEHYKVEIIATIPEHETITLYRQNGFVDLCRGPHVPSTGYLKAFKLTRLAGAYWRGDSRNEMLTRIYGVAFATQEALEAYLERLREAEARDHRRLGKALDLFHFQEEAPGMVFWHPHGWTIYQEIEQYMRHIFRAHGYAEIHTPQLVDRSLWERSGHWEKFASLMFVTHAENRDYAIKPMNCPCHVQVFNQKVRSYRELPLRLAEFGSCHRNEPSGTLHGLMRLRNFTQDDAHIFCTEAQIQEEVGIFIDLLFKVYHDFGFEAIETKLSTRPEERVGSDDIWDKAEKALASALDQKGIAWEIQAGEGAFYGPKIEFALRDSLNRVWQCGTIQVDFSMPGRLHAEYVAEDGSRQTPVMLHRAILGSLERFLGILIEHYAGALPVWLSPVQAAVLTITNDADAYAKEVASWLKEKGIRVETDLRNEKIGFKIREYSTRKIPYLLIVGKKEMQQKTVSMRTRYLGEESGITLEAAASKMLQAILQKANH